MGGIHLHHRLHELTGDCERILGLLVDRPQPGRGAVDLVPDRLDVRRASLQKERVQLGMCVRCRQDFGEDANHGTGDLLGFTHEDGPRYWDCLSQRFLRRLLDLVSSEELLRRTVRLLRELQLKLPVAVAVPHDLPDACGPALVQLIALTRPVFVRQPVPVSWPERPPVVVPVVGDREEPRLLVLFEHRRQGLTSAEVRDDWVVGVLVHPPEQLGHVVVGRQGREILLVLWDARADRRQAALEDLLDLRRHLHPRLKIDCVFLSEQLVQVLHVDHGVEARRVRASPGVTRRQGGSARRYGSGEVNTAKVARSDRD